MNLMCLAGIHKWDGYKCSRCGFESVVKKMIEAAWDGNVTVVSTLINAGAELNAKDGFGRTALIWASSTLSSSLASLGGHIEIVKLLLEKGANVNVKDKNGKTALQAWAYKGHVEIVKLLLEKGANINARDTDGWTALLWASYNGKVETVKLLLEKGADINARDKDGWTAMMQAAKKKHVDTVKLLKDNGAEEAKSEAGITNLYFEQERPYGDGLCSWDSCPCSSTGTPIPKGKGYLYIPQSAVDFRRDSLTWSEFMVKLNRIATRVPGGNLVFTDVPVLVCEQGLKKLGIDPKVAAQDAKHWWSTGLIPLRPSPLKR